MVALMLLTIYIIMWRGFFGGVCDLGGLLECIIIFVYVGLGFLYVEGRCVSVLLRVVKYSRRVELEYYLLAFRGVNGISRFLFCLCMSIHELCKWM